ncbi:MAG: hypothetical protein LAN63_07775 [Acidobacteriia bacterium]|nr:hypothetical protein [Terriglobia bacterium]
MDAFRDWLPRQLGQLAIQSLKSETAAFLIDGHRNEPRVLKNTRESGEMQTESIRPRLGVFLIETWCENGWSEWVF